MIGIFDSGSGGLTVLKEIVKVCPSADIIYFGDIANAPYGNRSLEELGALTILGFQKLLDNGATEIVSACNSVSAYITLPLFKNENIPESKIIEMVRPTVKSFKGKPNEKILILGTQATISSGIYQKGFLEIGLQTDSLAVPALAGAIESGESEEVLINIIGESFAGIDLDKYTSIILACTHFPLVGDLFSKVIGRQNLNLRLIDPSIFVAQEVKKRFGGSGIGELNFLISSDSDVFRKRVEEMFKGVPAKINVVK